MHFAVLCVDRRRRNTCCCVNYGKAMCNTLSMLWCAVVDDMNKYGMAANGCRLGVVLSDFSPSVRLGFFLLDSSIAISHDLYCLYFRYGMHSIVFMTRRIGVYYRIALSVSYSYWIHRICMKSVCFVVYDTTNIRDEQRFCCFDGNL